MVAGADRPLEELTAAQWLSLWAAAKAEAPPEPLA
jgi:hypothetical protein